MLRLVACIVIRLCAALGQTCFDKLFMGSFPMAKITAAREVHKHKIQEEIRQARLSRERREEDYKTVTLRGRSATNSDSQLPHRKRQRDLQKSKQSARRARQLGFQSALLRNSFIGRWI